MLHSIHTRSTSPQRHRALRRVIAASLLAVGLLVTQLPAHSPAMAADLPSDFTDPDFIHTPEKPIELESNPNPNYREPIGRYFHIRNNYRLPVSIEINASCNGETIQPDEVQECSATDYVTQEQIANGVFPARDIEYTLIVRPSSGEEPYEGKFSYQLPAITLTKDDGATTPDPDPSESSTPTPDTSEPASPDPDTSEPSTPTPDTSEPNTPNPNPTPSTAPNPQPSPSASTPIETRPVEIPAVETKPATTNRISGSNRVLTAEAIFTAANYTTDTVVLANGESQVDAATASPYANALGTGILLTNGKTIDTASVRFLADNNIKHVVIAGGTKAVSTDIAQTLADNNIAVTRISGPTRFATSEAFAQATRELNKKIDTVFYVDGANVIDALTVAPATQANNAVIVMLDANGLKADTPVLDKSVVVGDKAAANLKNGLTLHGDVTTIPGATNAAINVAFNTMMFGTTPQVYVASADTIADALAVGPLAATSNTPLVLVAKDSVADTTLDYLTGAKIASITILGGSAAVSDDLAHELANAPTT